MKNVAVITLTGDNNYGNKLQNYAMEQILIESGLRVETIRVKNKNDSGQSYHVLFFKNYIKYLTLPLLGDSKKAFTKRRYLFMKFNHLLHQAKDEIGWGVDSATSCKILAPYDYLVYGSDQIWNPQFSTFSTLYLGEFGKTEKNIALSASFGLEELDSSYVEFFKTGLKRFKAISVREDAGKSIINSIVPEVSVDVLIDPTLMLGADRWEKIEVNPKPACDKFAVAYFLGKPNEEKTKRIDKIKKENKTSLIDVGKEAPIGPREFLYYIHHADYVCTDSFHAFVFSILFTKDVFIFKRKDSYKSMSSRMDTLIGKLGLETVDYGDVLYISSIAMKSEKTQHSMEMERIKFRKFIETNME